MVWAKNNKVLVLILALAFFIRFVGIKDVPVSLFGDELDVGYHAYSILKTGKDYSGNSWPLHFRSLAEYRTPLYLYSSVPSVYFFGISPLGVRLPAVVFGVLCVWALYKLALLVSGSKTLALWAGFFLTVSPWHIQYSRAGFEVTQMMFFLLMGFYFFWASIRQKEKRNYIVWSTLCFSLAPWVYSTSKLFVPLIFMGLVIVYLPEIISRFTKRQIASAFLVILATSLPMIYTILNQGGGQRFGYLSVFNDVNMETIIGERRSLDNKTYQGDHASLRSRFFHNKYLYWIDEMFTNSFNAISADFLFVYGDPNLRHSVKGMGQFYRVDFVILALGLIIFFSRYKDSKIKIIFLLWLLFAVTVSSITQGGGTHATRLIIILPAMIIIMAYGINFLLELNNKFSRFIFAGSYLVVLLLSFVFYQHLYWIHYPLESEDWWHSGFEEAISTIKDIQEDYEKVIITDKDEPPWIFFAAHYHYPPDKWQAENPTSQTKALPEPFGEVSFTGKFHFGSIGEEDLYDLPKYIDSKTLYVASSKEIGVNLVEEPERVPSGLVLIEAISGPSGSPKFYILTAKDGTN